MSSPPPAAPDRLESRWLERLLAHADASTSRADFLRRAAEVAVDVLGGARVELRASPSEAELLGEGLDLGRLQPGESVVLRRGPGGSATWRVEPGGAEVAPGQALVRVVGEADLVALAPLAADGKTHGLMVVAVADASAAAVDAVGWRARVGALGHALATALTSHALRHALGERVKELTCLYALAKLTERREAPLEDLLGEAAALLPPGWQHPEIAVAAVELDGVSHATPGFGDRIAEQSADLVVEGERRGRVTVGYTEARPDDHEGPFIAEERALIDAVARAVADLVARRESAQAQERLEARLREADRLVTIGELAAGVAHELNEPLGGILGFAQLVRKSPELPAPLGPDIDRIVAASLRARDIIRQLLVFARQMPADARPTDLGAIVEDALSFLAPRCAKAGIEAAREVDPDLPPVRVDPAQIYQVLVNLIVNAIHGLEDAGGGRLEVRAARADDGAHALLVVSDDGAGMTEEARQNAFLPFFTTKDVGRGTGLGLAVVHGIVAAHGGRIDVTSAPGRGARFTVRLPIAGAPGGARP